MRKYSILYTAFVLIALLAVVNFFALSFYLYWTIWWLDNAVHFLGGFSLGFFMLYIFSESGFFGNNLSFSKAIFLSFVAVMMAGGAWEVFEYANGLTDSVENYALDVVHDLLFDALGAIFTLLIAK